MLDSQQHLGIDEFYKFLETLHMFKKDIKNEENKSYQLLIQQFNKLISIKKNFMLITNYIDGNHK